MGHQGSLSEGVASKADEGVHFTELCLPSDFRYGFNGIINNDNQ